MDRRSKLSMTMKSLEKLHVPFTDVKKRSRENILKKLNYSELMMKRDMREIDKESTDYTISRRSTK